VAAALPVVVVAAAVLSFTENAANGFVLVPSPSEVAPNRPCEDDVMVLDVISLDMTAKGFGLGPLSGVTPNNPPVVVAVLPLPNEGAIDVVVLVFDMADKGFGFGPRSGVALNKPGGVVVIVVVVVIVPVNDAPNRGVEVAGTVFGKDPNGFDLAVVDIPAPSDDEFPRPIMAPNGPLLLVVVSVVVIVGVAVRESAPKRGVGSLAVAAGTREMFANGFLSSLECADFLLGFDDPTMPT
jgi:hypothetical protein